MQQIKKKIMVYITLSAVETSNRLTTDAQQGSLTRGQLWPV